MAVSQKSVWMLQGSAKAKCFSWYSAVILTDSVDSQKRKILTFSDFNFASSFKKSA